MPDKPAGRDGGVSVEVVHGPRLRVDGVASWLRRVAPRRARGAVVIALMPDKRVRALNRLFRGVDKATDVLSFPSDDPGQLGEVAIAMGMARRQAAREGHALRTELRVLALHGLLHLLGYDHERDGGTMARVERRLRRAGGLPEGLIERSMS